MFTKVWFLTIVICSTIPVHGAETSQIVGTDFEAAALGSVSDLSSKEGVWHAETDGVTILQGYSRSGLRSLRLEGGEHSSVIFSPAVVHEKPITLTFWAQRWTQKGPFKFRVQALEDGKWTTIYRGDESVTTGQYTQVTIPWPDKPVKQFRMSCTSPLGRGVLIDDVSIQRKLVMQVESLTTEQRVTPVLVGNPVNPVLKIILTTPGNQDVLSIRRLKVTLDGTTNLSDIVNVEMYYTRGVSDPSWRDPQRIFREGVLFGESQAVESEIIFEGDQSLIDGSNYFWLSVTLKPNTDQDGVVDATCQLLTLSDGQELTPKVTSPEGTKRIGVALCNTGKGGIASYRIPGLVTTNEGTLIAVYDNRYKGWGDLPADIDIGMSRSTDGGLTWEPMRVIADMGDAPKWNSDGVGDPSILVDRNTNTVWVTGLWSHGDNGFHGSGQGMTPEETGQVILVKSEDDGVTWSQPINITKQVKDPRWRLIFQGPGRGITTRKGTLVFPAQFIDEQGVVYSTIIYSLDHGDTWSIGTGVKPDTTESQVVELADGSLMLNMRDNRGGSRSVAVTSDLGETWQTHPTSRHALPEPICQASLITFTPNKHHEHDWLIFSNPAVSDKPRRNMTIKASLDQGMTWPKRYQLLIDENPSRGYSCLTQIDEHTLGILYEGSMANMTFLRVPIKDVVAHNPKDKASPGN